MSSASANWIAGHAVTTPDTVDLHDPYEGVLVGTACYPSADNVEGAVAATHDGSRAVAARAAWFLL